LQETRREKEENARSKTPTLFQLDGASLLLLLSGIDGMLSLAARILLRRKGLDPDMARHRVVW
jgi:hypothetical protein